MAAFPTEDRLRQKRTKSEQAISLAMKNRFSGAKEEEATSTRQALTATTAATELRRSGATVLTVIAFDRASAEAIATVVGL